MAVKWIIIFIFGAMMAVTRGYSTGAPVEVCKDMKPKHPYEPQTSVFPYKVTVDKNQIKSGDKVKITITGGKPFKGFMVQVRDATGVTAVGSFSVNKAIGKTINCGQAQSTVTHSNDSEKSGISLEWTSPTGTTGSFTVFVTVAQDGATFWVKQATATITII